MVTLRERVTVGVLFLTGLYLLLTGLNGQLSLYIHMRFAWLIYTTAILLIIIAIGYLFSAGNRASSETGLAWHNILIVALPLLFSLVFKVQIDDTESVSGYISIAPFAEIRLGVQAYIPPIDRNVLDWLEVFEMTDNPAELAGLPVDIVAFVYREPGLPENQFMAARLVPSVFGGGSQAVGMPVEYESAPELENGMWMDIQGYLQVGEFRGIATPILIPESLVETDAPADHVTNHDHEHEH